MAAVDGGGFNLEDDIGAKISGFRKEYDNDRDGRDDYGKLNQCRSRIFDMFKLRSSKFEGRDILMLKQPR